MKKKIGMFIVLMIALMLVLTLVGCGVSISIMAPAEGSTLTTSPTVVRGSVSNSKAIVTVNDMAVELDKKGNFATTIEPVEGSNTISIEAA
ncbi:MAG: hypothetical protein JW737_05465, partial [Acidobacteria bacterium]|nr:hypothetical protein [Acidobacteriota bacterium]